METVRVSRRRFKCVLYLLCYGFFALQASAAYRIVLKDGTALEARAKPISMWGSYGFAAPDGQFRVIPFEQVDVEATKAANPAAETVTRPKVFTNEDFPARAPEPARTGIPPAAPAPRSVPAQLDQQERGNPPLSEAYWRELAGNLQQRIAEADGMIASLKAEIEKEVRFCGDENCILLAVWPRGPELRALEARKNALEAEFELLVERARKAGAPPGWLR